MPPPRPARRTPRSPPRRLPVAFDDDPATAWVEGVEGDGLGESIEWPVSGLRSARGVRVDVRNGYQKSATLFAANGAPKDVRVEVLSPAGAPIATLDTTLTRTLDWQSVTVAVPADQPFNAVRLTIRSVWPGNKYRDTRVSDLRTFVDSDVVYDPAFEAQKHASLLAWRKERLGTAAWYKTHAAESPWQTAEWETTPVEATPASVDTLLAPLRARRHTLEALPLWWRASVRTGTPVPERLREGYGNLPEVPVLATDLSLYEATGSTNARSGDQGELYTSEDGSSSERIGWWSQRQTNRHVEWVDSAHSRPRAMQWTVTYRSDGREVSEWNEVYLAEYNDDGRLARVYSFKEQHGDSYCWDEAERLWSYSWDSAGHITQVTAAATTNNTRAATESGQECKRQSGGFSMVAFLPATPLPTTR